LLFAQLTLRDNSRANWMRKSELAKRTDAGAINTLVKKGVFEEQEMEIDRISFLRGVSVNKTLNLEQEEVFKRINELFEKQKPVLLKGVTGSGKTEVYIRLIEKELEAGGQVLYLVPEIALTTQLIKRLRAVFNEKVGVYHSRFSENERVEIWNNILRYPNESSGDKNYRLIIAARSGLFLPFSNLGLIIVDEEHDYSYKQQSPAPRYHARDAAVYLATFHKSKILLGSATPSLESYYNAQSGKFEIAELHKTFSQTGEVDVEICDLKLYEAQQNMKGVLTPPLYNAIQTALALRQQVILFQNRRGFAPYTQCNSCGTVPYCVNCDVPLIYHKYIDKLSCHYCGYHTVVPKVCAACGKPDLRFRGLGTEKIEEDLEMLFPDATIARMDLDTTRSKYAHRQLIDDFEAGQIDILIGTQMVTKGLDFDNVSVVGVLNIDSTLNFPDFRSHERAYQLLTQLRGRAGRKNHKGKLYIQTAQPNHQILSAILQSDVSKFYADQLREREVYHYPPFVRLIELNVISAVPDELHNLAAELAAELKNTVPAELLGPEFPPVSRIRGKYHKRILLKFGRKQSLRQMRELIHQVLVNVYSANKKMKFTIQVNVDP
jgi:primosomal protein N' (replication factor Y)